MSKRSKIIFHVVSSLVLLFSFSFIFWNYQLNFQRLLMGFSDFREAFSLWWKVSFTRELKFGAVEFVPEYNFTALFDYIKFDISDFQYKFKNLFPEMFDSYNFGVFNYWFLIKSMYVLLYFVIALTILTVIQTLLEINLTSASDKPGEDTALLRVYKRIEAPIGRAVHVIVEYVKRFISSPYWFWFLFIWLINLNVAAIFIEFLAFIFGYPISASGDSLLLYIGMLVSDVVIAMASAPLLIWFIIFYIIFNKIRFARAYRVLNRLYNYDVGFLKGCAYNVLLDGPTGASKTKTAVQMAIMTEDYFHTDQWESMYKFFQQYPEFPFFDFEQDLKAKIEEGVITNMHNARNYVECLKCEVIKKPVPEKLYNYTGVMYHNDGVRFIPIWEMLYSYAQLYYMYRNDTSSIIANLSIRSDLRMLPGHFPIWDNRLMRRTPEYYHESSKFCHILNWNMFRFSKLVDDEPADVNLEYGVNVMTEFDKDQGNQNTNKVYDIKDEKANPLNDGTDLFLMLERHLGTVDFKCYIRNFADIQREGTLREGVKGLYDELNISDKAEPRLTLPFFFEGWIIGKLDSWLSSFTLEVKNCGTAHTLPYYLLRRILFPLSNLVRRLKQRFTYEEIQFTIRNACSPEGVYKQHPFYVLYCIAHSNRYSTDCYASLNDEAAKYHEGGIQDIPCYQSIKPELHELPKQKSYFSQKQLDRLKRIKKQKRKK